MDADPLAAMLDRALARIDRLSAEEAAEQVAFGATLVDIRPGTEVLAQGTIPKAVHVERTKLEWRVAPGSPWREPRIRLDRPLILICSEGYGSILAAAAMQDLGFPGATDVVGGFVAWQRAGLPVVPPVVLQDAAAA